MSENIWALSFDTIVEHLYGASVNLDQKLGHSILHDACCHHILELVTRMWNVWDLSLYQISIFSSATNRSDRISVEMNKVLS